MDKTRGVRKSERITKTWGVTILNGKNTFSLIFSLFPKFRAALKLLYIELFPLHWMWLPCSELTKSNKTNLCNLELQQSYMQKLRAFLEHLSSFTFHRVSCRQDLQSIVLSIVVCFPGPDVIKKILCWARLLAVGTMDCRNNGLSE
jgi:hypothetical protein